MKRATRIVICIALWICTACMVLFCCDTRGLLPLVSDAGDLMAVMTEEELPGAIHNRFYLVNTAGNYVCVRLENEGYGDVESVQIFDGSRIIPTQFHFSMIKQGMSPEQVTALVGIPFQPMSEGVDRSAYEASDGTVYAIAWAKDSQTGKLATAGGAEQIQGMHGPGIVRSTQLRAWIWNHIAAAFLLSAMMATVNLRKKPN